jgi:small subunit ribosomal protein S5
MENKQPKVINKSGTTKLTDEAMAAKEAKAERDFKGRRRDNRRNRRAAEEGKKEFDTVNISINRVSRTVAGGRRMRFQALVAMGDHKNRIGIGLAKGNDVTSAVQKAERRAKKNMITFNINKDTICHEVETKITGAHVLMKPAAPGTGIIAGGVVRSIIGLTGVKNLISKSLGSTNKANIAYAVIEGLRQQVPKADWNGSKKAEKAEKPAKKETK